MAPFWTTFLWAYAPYGPSTKDLPYGRLSEIVNQSATAALRDGTYTSTGEAYGAVTRGR